METNNLDLGKSFDKLKEEIRPSEKYGMKKMAIGGMTVLTRDGKPIMPIPEEFVDDFIYILSRVSTYERLFTNQP